MVNSNQFKRFLDLISELTNFSSLEIATNEKTRIVFETRMAELRGLVADLRTLDIEPFRKAIGVILSGPVSDKSLLELSVIRILTAKGKGIHFSEVERQLPSVLSHVFMIGLDFGVPVKDWESFAEICRQTVLCYLRSGDKQDANYLAALEVWKPIHLETYNRLSHMPEYAKRFEDAQYQ